MHKLFLPLLGICLCLSAASLAAQDKAADPVTKLFESYDRDGDGKLDREELDAARSRVDDAEFIQQASAADAEAVLRRAEFLSKFDKNGDGRFSESELAAAKAEIESQSEVTSPNYRYDAIKVPESNLRRIILKVDKDGDGNLTFAEFAVVKAVLDDSHSFHQRAFTEWDKDGDGKLDIEESNARARFHISNRVERQKAFVRLYDKNGNGRIDRDESAAWRADLKELAEELTKKYDADDNGVLSFREIYEAIADGAAEEDPLAIYVGDNAKHDMALQTWFSQFPALKE